jgi:(1->4)-alpha-D-glucan 1-alpha-D-glucosylmutase
MGDDNPWWMDVLENGPASTYASFFDIDWTRGDPDLAGRILVPVLGDAYGTVLERGELALEFDAENGAFAVAYFEHRFPIDPKSYGDLLLSASALARAQASPGDVGELESIAYTLKALPARDDPSRPRIATRRRLTDELKRRLATLVHRDPRIGEAIARSVLHLNGSRGERASFDALHRLLEAQAFRLAHWRVAADEVNYRRFFDINELAALRNEDPEVLEATHGFVLDLAAAGLIGGLRIDHPDGLLDPKRYFAALQARYRDKVAGRHDADVSPGIFVVVEKIAAPHERIPEDWAVHGTTGYRFANVVNGLFVDTRVKARIDRIWRTFVGDEAEGFEQTTYDARRAIVEGPLASELRVLTLRALRLALADPRTRDFTFNALRQAIIEIVARFPVYRTYVDADGASPQDRRYVGWAVGRARARSRTSDPSTFDFLQQALLGEAPQDSPPATIAAYRDFAMRFQQFSAPVAGKGVEDTSFYRFNRLVSLNEVGGDPEQFGLGVRAFHAASADRAARWPHTMLATSTHDNKRSEDVRARIDVLSEMPGAWRAMLRRWSMINRSRKMHVDGAPAPSRNDEYLLYQTLVGTYATDEADDAVRTVYRDRIAAYMRKAVREAKVHTSWLAPNDAYEAALDAFVAGLLGGDGEHAFLPDFRRECAAIAWFGLLSSVSMTLLKVASPGVPDVYQGNELLDLSLVDPDNRRPVDYARRRTCLRDVTAIDDDDANERPARLRALFDAPFDGRAKLFVLARALALRRRHPALFAYADYRPVRVVGAKAEHVVAFARIHEDRGIVVAAGRLFASLGVAAGSLPVATSWGDTALDLSFVPRGEALRDAVTGRSIDTSDDAMPLARLFADFPGTLLVYGAERGDDRLRVG